MTAIGDLYTAMKMTRHAPPDERRRLQKQARRLVMQVYADATKEMSLYDFGNAVRAAVRAASPQAPLQTMEPAEFYWYVEDIYPEGKYAIVCVQNGVYYKVGYTVGEDDKVTLAGKDKWVKVERQWVEIPD